MYRKIYSHANSIRVMMMMMTPDTEQASITEWHDPHGVAQTSKEGHSRIALL